MRRARMGTLTRVALTNLSGVMAATHWSHAAACRDHIDLFNSAADHSDNHPERRRHGYHPDVTAAVAICRRCPVEDECLLWALERREKYGVLGGFTPRQREAMRRKAAR